MSAVLDGIITDAVDDDAGDSDIFPSMIIMLIDR